MSKRDKGGASGVEAPLENVRRERFALAVATGQTLTEAYRSAYPRSVGWNPGNVRKAASELAAVAEVARRIAALRSAVASEDCASRHDVLLALSEAIRDARKDHALAGSARLVDIYCRMCGFYEPEKIEARVGLLSDSQRDAKIARLLVARRQG